MRQTSIHHSANLERFSGFAALYDDVRPQPPATIIDVLLQLAQIERPRLVVDLGCGAGLSTRIWAERADQVVGVEPSADMRRQADRNFKRAIEIGEARGFYDGVKHWNKEGHLPRMLASGRFRYTKEIVLHNKEMGNAE